MDLDKLEELNARRSPGEWGVDDDEVISNEDGEYIGDWDLSFADEEFVLEMVNNAKELIRLARLGRSAEKAGFKP